MAPWQSGNSFIALGVAYFISALLPRLIARYSMGRILLTGLAVADRRSPCCCAPPSPASASPPTP